jgi:hypothetical protein
MCSGLWGLQIIADFFLLSAGLSSADTTGAEHFAAGPNTSLAMIMRGRFAGLYKNPPYLQAYCHAFNIYCYITFNHNLTFSCIPCTFIITIGLLLKRFRVCLELLCFSFLSSAPTFCSQTPPAPKLSSKKRWDLGQLHNIPRAPQGVLHKPTFSTPS